MNSADIRSRFLRFFEQRGHAAIASASLVTSDDKGLINPTLFNTAGMQPLIPFLLGKPHPMGKRLVDVQKCLRTVDIDDIGDKTHATFFEMLGNWSLGDYFKKEAINWSYEFLTDPKEGLGLDPSRLYITVFEGDANAPRDDEAADIWRATFKAAGIDVGESSKDDSAKKGRIFFMSASMNWWEAGENGPCGPDTEMYYDVANAFKGKLLSHDEFLEADSARNVIEVWNDVFMQYEKKDGKIVGTLPKPSVDTGAGLERLTMTMQGVDNIYDTDLLKPVMDLIQKHSTNWNLKSARIIADHIRASIFLISDDVIPLKTGRGYVLRKLLRRAFQQADLIKMNRAVYSDLVDSFINTYANIYNLKHNSGKIKTFIIGELTDVAELEGRSDVILEKKFDDYTNRIGKTPARTGKVVGDKMTYAHPFISGEEAFEMFSSLGIPKEKIFKFVEEKGFVIDKEGFDSAFKKHQDLSRSGAEQKFKGGLADDKDPMVVRYHTATHLLHQALHDVLGDSVGQKGSNITAERLRFDFSHTAKMTDEEKKKVEDIVNAKIQEGLPMNKVVMRIAEAEKTGARHFFGEKYGDEVSIYFIGPASNPPVPSDLKNAYSKEFCGGPHVSNTSELAGPEGKWKFKIQKEEAVSQGVRRIKAILA